jgi:hypothetical protein
MRIFVRDLSKRWRTEQFSDILVAIYPLNDKIPHDLREQDCICGPALDPIEEGVGWILTHHSLDGRENAEGPILAAMEAGERIVILDRHTAYTGSALGLLAVVTWIWRKWPL